jgi:acetyl-CoA carboxylase alpha subunit
MNQEQIKSILQVLLGTGGPLAALVMSYGVPADRLTLWTNLVLAIVPPAAAALWALWDRTQKNTLAQAGAILAVPAPDGKPQGNVIINPVATDGAKAAAADPTVGNVNYGKVTS